MTYKTTLYLYGGLLCLPIFNACVPAPRIQITDELDLPSFEVKSEINRGNLNRTLYLRNIPERVRGNHPQLIAARKAIDVAEGKLSQSGRLQNPELEIATSSILPTTEGEIGVSFSQRFPYTNKLSLEKRVHRNAVLVAYAEVEIIELKLSSQAQILATEILGKDHKHSLLEKQKKAYQSVVDWITRAAERGEISKFEANVPQMEVQAITLKQQQLLSQKALLIQQLKGLVGMPSNRDLSVIGSLSKGTSLGQPLNLEKHPLYRAKKLLVSQSKSNILLEKANRYEDPELIFSGAIGREEDAPNGIETEGSIGVGLSIPLPLYNKNEGNIKAATAQAETHILELQALEASIKNQAAEHKLSIQSWVKQYQEIEKTMLPLARKNTQQLENAYQSGQGDYLSFLQAKKQTIELEKQLSEARLEIQRARVKYYNAIGRPQSAF